MILQLEVHTYAGEEADALQWMAPVLFTRVFIICKKKKKKYSWYDNKSNKTVTLTLDLKLTISEIKALRWKFMKLMAKSLVYYM